MCLTLHSCCHCRPPSPRPALSNLDPSLPQPELLSEDVCWSHTWPFEVLHCLQRNSLPAGCGPAGLSCIFTSLPLCSVSHIGFSLCPECSSCPAPNSNWSFRIPSLRAFPHLPGRLGASSVSVPPCFGSASLCLSQGALEGGQDGSKALSGIRPQSHRESFRRCLLSD